MATGKGTFEITMQAEPPFEEVSGVTLSRASFEKRFSGALNATSQVHMLASRTPVESSAGYVAVERITGKLEARDGSFVVLHRGIMARGARSLELGIVPDSGTGDLKGISGTMSIDIVNGQHHYTIEYAFDAS